MTNGNEPIAPTKIDPESDEKKKSYHWDGNDFNYYGLTKREYFAAMAMQGLLANESSNRVPEWRTIATAAVKMSDEITNELNKQP